MKKVTIKIHEKVAVYLPFRIVTWLLKECDFIQDQITSIVSDIESSGKHTEDKHHFIRDFCYYDVLHTSLVNALVSRVHSKKEDNK